MRYIVLFDYRRDPMLAKTRQTNDKILMNKTKSKGMGYTAPEQLSNNISAGVREKKHSDSELRARLTAEIRIELPAGTEEVINAIVTRKIYEIEQAANVPDDPELTLRPNMKKTIRHDTITMRHHNGKYEVDRFSRKGKKAWSCCMNKHEESDGCVVKKVDKQKWNVEGFWNQFQTQIFVLLEVKLSYYLLLITHYLHCNNYYSLIIV